MAVLEVNEDVIALDIVMGHVVRLNDLKSLENFTVNGQVLTQVVHNVRLLAKTPLTQRPRVLLHHDIVARLIDSIVEEVGDAWFEAELLQAGDLREDVVEHTSVRDGLRQAHLLDSDALWLCKLGLTFVHYAVLSCCQLPPALAVIVERNVEERGTHQFQEPDTC